MAAVVACTPNGLFVSNGEELFSSQVTDIFNASAPKTTLTPIALTEKSRALRVIHWETPDIDPERCKDIAKKLQYPPGNT